jgi:opacity protein-like surface antigen
MNICNPLRRAGLVLALSACAATSAFAKDSGFYLGASAGQSMYDVDESAFYTFPTVRERTFNDKDWAYSLDFGYRINKFIGVELSLVDYGNLDYQEMGFITTNPSVGGLVGFQMGTRGVALSAIGTLPLDKFELFAKVGGLRAETKFRARIANSFGTLPLPTGVGQETVKSTVVTYGAGVGYNINDSFFLKLEYTLAPKVSKDDDDIGIDTDVSAIMLGFQVRF